MQSQLSARIKQIRELKGLTQTQLGDLLGVTQVTVARWETGTRMKLETLEAIAKTLNVPLCCFFENEPHEIEIKYKQLSRRAQQTVNDLIDFLLDREKTSN